MIEEVEDWVVLQDGTRLFEKTWKSAAATRAHLIFFHGFSDRCEIHYHLFPTLASHPYNITCHAVDQRGWGKSVHTPSQQGLTGSTERVLADMEEYVHHVSINKVQDLETTPLFIMGHSMGGQQVLHYLLSTSSALPSVSKLAGAIVEAPYIALDPKSEPSSILVVAGKVAAMISPRTQMKQHLDSKYISRDPSVNQAWEQDPLCHNIGTLEGLRDMLKRGADLAALSTSSSANSQRLNIQLPIPVYWTHGTADRITAFRPSRALFDLLLPPADSLTPAGSLSKTFQAYEGAYHKIHAEPNGVGVSFSRDVARWIVDVVAAKQCHTSDSSKLDCSKPNTSPGSETTTTRKVVIKANL